MRKLFLTLVLCATSLGMFAQEIEYDKVEQDGTRFIFCSEINPNKLFDKFKIFPSLSVAKSNTGDKVYNLSLRIPSMIPISMNKSSVLLIKTFENEIITLYSEQEYSDNIGSYVPEIKRNNFTINPSYTITEDDLNKLKNGVSKIRVETTIETFDKEFKSDKMGEDLYNEFNLIEKALTKDKSIYDDF